MHNAKEHGGKPEAEVYVASWWPSLERGVAEHPWLGDTGRPLLAQRFLEEGGYEALLGDDWREKLESAQVTFADEDHASIPPLVPDEEEGPAELVRQLTG
jgi:hypothetical protein